MRTSNAMQVCARPERGSDLRRKRAVVESKLDLLYFYSITLNAMRQELRNIFDKLPSYVDHRKNAKSAHKTHETFVADVA